MTAAPLLGALSTTHELLSRLVEALPDSECSRRFHPDLAPLGWYLGRSVYLELHWLRELLAGDGDLADRVRDIFPSEPVSDEQIARLPPKDHLLNWALEIQDEHLTRLANPGMLPANHPLLRDDWLINQMLQAEAALYEKMLAVMHARALEQAPDYHVIHPLVPRLPAADAVDVHPGHFRIGARDGDPGLDNERPAQMVELSAFRMGRGPVSNAEYLAFIVDGGYEQEDHWDESGRAWLQDNAAQGPYHWRRDEGGRWYGVGLGGAADLPADEPVSGICLHEARAYSRWAAARGGELSGAVLPHEYQWEVAARNRDISGFGRAWEWCENRFEPYDSYQPPEGEELASSAFDGRHHTQKGGCLHTQPSLRRASYRRPALPDERHGFAGLRLVFPPGKPFWE